MNHKIPLIEQSHLKERGFFYVGGEIVGEEGNHFLCNQMFVEAYVPCEQLHEYPIILFHGAGQTNMNWLITPDARMGWADYFLRKGYCVYLVEQPARGRSAYHPEVNGPTTHHSLEVLENRFVSDQGRWPQAKKHTQFPFDSLSWGDETLRQFFAAQVEYLPDNREVQKLVLNAGRQLLQMTGPAILLTHSQAGPFGWLLADDQPELVKGIVALEPSGPPFTVDPSSGKARNYGITDLPMHFEPQVDAPDTFELVRLPAPSAELRDGWMMKEPARKLPRLQGIPILLLVSESSYHAGYDHLTSRFLEQAGVDHDFVRLENVGIHGNGHMMMLEKNNLEIAEWIANWLAEKNIG